MATFYQWKRKLAACSADKTPRAAVRLTPPRRSRPDAGQESPFFRVALPQPMAGATWVELTLGNGTIVRVPSQNLAALELVLRSTQHPA